MDNSNAYIITMWFRTPIHTYIKLAIQTYKSAMISYSLFVNTLVPASICLARLSFQKQRVMSIAIPFLLVFSRTRSRRGGSSTKLSKASHHISGIQPAESRNVSLHQGVFCNCTTEVSWCSLPICTESSLCCWQEGRSHAHL